MKKKEIVKLVFAAIFLVAAIGLCVFAVSLRSSLDAVGQDSTAEGEEAVGEAIGNIFVVFFGALAAILMAFAAVIGDIISTIICAFGLKAPEKPSKIVFAVLLALNLINAVIAILGTFVGF